MIKVSERDFDRIVRKAIAHIPGEIRKYLDNLVISVQRRPSPEVLDEMGFEEGEGLLGLFQGVPLTERTVTAPPLFPDTILLFQEPLQEMCRDLDELEEQIEITVVHEVAHFVGMNEARLAELGYA